MNPYEPKSKTVIWKRYQYINDEQLRQTIQKNHTDSSIYKAPNDAVFLGRCSLLKSVQSGFRLWHVTYVKMIRAINAKYDGL